MQSVNEVSRKYEKYLTEAQKNLLKEKGKQLSMLNAPTRMQIQSGAIKGVRRTNEMLSNYGLARSLRGSVSSGLDEQARLMPGFQSQMQGLRAKETAQLDQYGYQYAQQTIAARQRAAEEAERRARRAAAAAAAKRAKAASMKSASDFVNDAIKNGMSEMDAAKYMEAAYKGDTAKASSISKQYYGSAEHNYKMQSQALTDQYLESIKLNVDSGLMDVRAGAQIASLVRSGDFPAAEKSMGYYSASKKDDIYKAASEALKRGKITQLQAAQIISAAGRNELPSAMNALTGYQKYNSMMSMSRTEFNNSMKSLQEEYDTLLKRIKKDSKAIINAGTGQIRGQINESWTAEDQERFESVQTQLEELKGFQTARMQDTIDKYSTLDTESLDKFADTLKAEQKELRENGYKNGESDYEREEEINEQLSLINAARMNVQARAREESYTAMQSVSQKADFAARAAVGSAEKGNTLHQLMTSGATPEMEAIASQPNAQGAKMRSDMEVVGLMRDEEKQTYNYYLSQGQEQADAYMKQLETYINERRIGQMQELAQSRLSGGGMLPAWLSGITQSIASVLATPAEFTGALYSGFQGFTGQEIDPYNPAFTASIYKTTVREGVGNQIAKQIADNEGNDFLGRAMAFGYQTLMSVADNALLIALGRFGGQPLKATELYTLGTMSMSSGASTVREAKASGATDEQALVLGAFAGTFEALFEKAPLENLLNMNTDAASSWIKRTLEQASIEASEEFCTEIAGILTNAAVMGDQSDYNNAVAEYLKEGKSMSEARSMAFMDLLLNIGLAAAGGFLSGGMMGGVGSFRANTQLKSRGEQLKQAVGVQTLLDEAKTVDNEKVQKLYAKLSNAFKSNQSVKNIDIGRLDALMDESVSETFEKEIDAMAADGRITAAQARTIKENPELAAQYGYNPEGSTRTETIPLADRLDNAIEYDTDREYMTQLDMLSRGLVSENEVARFADVQNTINRMQEVQNGLQVSDGERGRIDEGSGIGSVARRLRTNEKQSAAESADIAGNGREGSADGSDAREVSANESRASIRGWEDQDQQNLTKAVFDFNAKEGRKDRTDSVVESVKPEDIGSDTYDAIQRMTDITKTDVRFYRFKGEETGMYGASVRGRAYASYTEGNVTENVFQAAHETCETISEYKSAGYSALSLIESDLLPKYKEARGGTGDTNELVCDMFGAYMVAQITGDTTLYDRVLGEHNQEAIDAFEIVFDDALSEGGLVAEPSEETKHSTRRITDPLADQMYDMRKQGQQNAKAAETAKQRAERILAQHQDKALANQMADMRKQAQQSRTEREQLILQQVRENARLMRQSEAEKQRLVRQQKQELEKQQRTNERNIKKISKESEQAAERYEKKILLKDAKIDQQREEIKRMKVAERVKVQEARERAEERHAKERAVKQTVRSVNALRRMLVSPTKEAHVPTFMRGVVADLVNLIDLGNAPGVTYKNGTLKGSSKRVQSWREAMSALRDSLSETESKLQTAEYEQLMATLPSGFVDDISDFISVLTQNEPQYLADMTSEEVRELNRIISTVRGAVTGVNRLHYNLRYKTVEELGSKTISEAKGKRGKKAKLEKLDNFFNSQMLDFFSWGHSIGESGESVTQMISDGYFDRTVRRVQETKEFMTSLYSRHSFSQKNAAEWRKNVHTIELASGEQIDLAETEIMELYALSFRPQAMQHILGGGIKSETGNNDSQHPYQITEDDLDTMFEILSEQQIDIVSEMQRFMSDTVSAWGNEVTQRLYLFDGFSEQYYWPIRSSGGSLQTPDPDKDRAFNAILNSSFTKQLNRHANNPIQIGDAFDSFIGHCSQMANYNGLAIPVQDTMKWLNYRAKKDDGSVNHDATVKTALNRIGGEKAESYIRDFIKDLNGLNARSKGIELAEKLTSNVKRAAIAAKIRVVIQQPTSVLRATAMIDPKYFATMNNFNVKRAVSEMKKYAPIAWWKSNGNYEIGLGHSMRSMIMGEETLLDRANDVLMKPAALADDLGWSWIWNACKQEAKATTNLTVNSPEFFEHVAKRFTDVCNATQVIDTPLHRSQVMRSKDGLVKQSTAFMSEPAKQYNIIRNAVVDIQRNKVGAKKKFVRTMSAVVASQMMNALVTAAWDAARKRGEDEEKTFAELFGETWVTNFTSGINPLANIPFVKDVWGIVAGDGVPDRMDMVSVESAWRSITRAYDHIVGNPSEYTSYYVWTNLAKQLSSVFGLPTNGLISSAESLIDIAFPSLLRRTRPKLEKEWQQEMLKEADVSGMRRRDFYDLYEDLGESGLKAADKVSILADADVTTEQKAIMARRASESLDNRLSELKRRGASDKTIEDAIRWYSVHSGLTSTKDASQNEQFQQLLLADDTLTADEKALIYNAVTSDFFSGVEAKIFKNELLANAEKNALYEAIGDKDETMKILSDTKLDDTEREGILKLSNTAKTLDFSSAERLRLSTMDGSAYDRALAAERNGVSNKSYLKYYELDAEEKTSRDDVYRAIMADKSLTANQKAALETALFRTEGKTYSPINYTDEWHFYITHDESTTLYPMKLELAERQGFDYAKVADYVKRYQTMKDNKTGSGKNGAVKKKDSYAIMADMGFTKSEQKQLYEIMTTKEVDLKKILGKD